MHKIRFYNGYNYITKYITIDKRRKTAIFNENFIELIITRDWVDLNHLN